ncbi:MAG: hypothetical protein A2X64_03860 [Ignavibacteria bacterium GWF2_33_9]|nr:MAG: hypothetical protein A2X64_03860 [Ignavibacteria bacterium GWF2_33_9]
MFASNAFCNVAVTPIMQYYYNIYPHNNQLFLLANLGFISKYNLDTKEFSHQKIFKGGRTLNLIEKNELIFLFNVGGQAAISSDNGINWEIRQLPKNNIISVIRVDDNFLFRDSNSIFLTDNNFNLIKDFQLFSPPTKNRIASWMFSSDYTKSMCVFNNQIIVEADSNHLLKFSKNLELIDDINVRQTILYDSSLVYAPSNFILLTDSNDLYINYYQTTNQSIPVDKIWKTNDLINFTLVSCDSTMYNKYRIQDGNFQKVNITDSLFIDANYFSLSVYQSSGFSVQPNSTYWKDFIQIGNEMYLVGLKGLFEKVNLLDSSIVLINENIQISSIYNPIIIDDNNAIFLSGYNYQREKYIQPYFYRTRNKGLTFNSTIKKDNLGYNDSLRKTHFYLYLIDSSNFNITLLGRKHFQSTATAIFNTSDTLKTFEIFDTEMEYVTRFNNLLGSYANFDFRQFRLKQTMENNYWIEPSRTSPWKTVFTSFRVTDQNYRNSWYYLDTNKIIDYVYFRDTNNFAIHYANLLDSARSSLKYTTDRGTNWVDVHNYDVSDTLRGLYDVKLNNRDYLILFHQNTTKPDTAIFMDVYLPVENRFTRLKEWKLRDFNTTYISAVAFGSNNKVASLVVGDTLFYIEDFYDFSKWKYRLLENKGYINGLLTMWGNKLVSYYHDDNTESSYYILTFSDTTLNSIDEIEKRDYFYSYDIYPNPAHDRVTVQIYWDMGLDIGTADIGIYNIYGNKIEADENIEILQESDWSGKLTWNCSGVPVGTYFIKIDYGTETKVIKFVKI